MTEPPPPSHPVARDAVRAINLAFKIVNYAFALFFTVGLSLIGLASFFSTQGTTGHRFMSALGTVAFFGIGFGLLFLSQYVVRQILLMFFNLGIAASVQPPPQDSPETGGNSDSKAPPAG